MGSLSLGTQLQRVLFDRIPWLWYDRVATRVAGPSWAVVVLVVLLYVSSAVLAALGGALPEFLRDPLWPVMIGFVAIGTFVAGHVPRAVGRLWASLRPWLANPEDEVTELEGGTRGLLMRPFWGFSLVVFVTSLPYFFVTPPSVELGSSYEKVYVLLNIVLTPFLAYFIGTAGSLCTWGVAALAWRMSRQLRLKQGFVLEGGKAALRPFNTLLWVVWGAFAIPVMVGTLVIVALQPAEAGDVLALLNWMALGIGGVLAIPTVVLPQLFMNGWLARQKAEELRELRRQLEEAATPPAERDTYQVLRQMHRHQHLALQVQQVEAFTPTLVDTRFVLQIGTTITAILLANVLLRTALERFLS